MSISIENGSGHLICDGVDKGSVEYSIAVPEDGDDLTKRGKLWGNRDAIATALDASIIKLVSEDADVAFTIEVEELDRDGSVPFTVSASAL